MEYRDKLIELCLRTKLPADYTLLLSRVAHMLLRGAMKIEKRICYNTIMKMACFHADELNVKWRVSNDVNKDVRNFDLSN